MGTFFTYRGKCSQVRSQNEFKSLPLLLTKKAPQQRQKSVLVQFFFRCRSFSLCIGGRQDFSFSHRRYKIFMFVFQQKISLLFSYHSLQIPVALCLVELRWPAACFLFFCLCQALYSKFVDMTTQIQKQFPLSVFVLVDSLFVSALFTRRGWRFPSKITSVAFGLTYLLQSNQVKGTPPRIKLHFPEIDVNVF